MGEENIPASGRFVFVSNHPLGGLDGIGLIAFLGKRYGDDHLRFLVNDVLMAVKPLDNVFCQSTNTAASRASRCGQSTQPMPAISR